MNDGTRIELLNSCLIAVVSRCTHQAVLGLWLTHSPEPSQEEEETNRKNRGEKYHVISFKCFVGSF